MAGSGAAGVRRSLLPDRDLDDGLQVYRHPGLFADLADVDFNLPERRLDRGGAVLAGDGRRSTSGEAAPADRHPQTAARATVAPADDHGEQPLEENIALQGRPFVHRFALRRRKNPCEPWVIAWGESPTSPSGLRCPTRLSPPTWAGTTASPDLAVGRRPSLLSEHEVHDPASADVRPRPAAVAQDVVAVAAGVLKRVRKGAEPLGG
jgi:hypothetical protein